MEIKSDLSVALSACCGSDGETLVMATVNTPAGSGPSSCDVVCVVDVSGSMSTEAKTQNSKGDVETHGLSILDIVRHAVKTIVNILQSRDRLSLVVFSTEARTIFNLISMDDAGKKKALSEIEKLAPENSTNIWGGLKMGLDVLKNSDNKEGRIQSVLILTDGQPNVIPPEGHLPALKKYKDENPTLRCSINTFGFGYNLDSALLQDLAIEGDGMYAFIPDSGFVGTAFVHSISNQLVTIATGSQLSLETLNGTTLVEKGVVGGYPTQYSSWGAQVNLGSLQYGQSRNVIFRVKVKSDSDPQKPFVAITLKYGKQEVHAESNQSVINKSIEGEIEVQHNRLISVDAIRNALVTQKGGNASKARESIKKLISDIKATPSAKSDQRVKELLVDLEGQVTEALSKDEFFTKWGVHYLPSLLNAHLLQMCNNFKDPGVQVYGGKLFSDQRDRADDIFVKLPPPKPSYKTSAPVASMSYYHSSANPCFHGNSLVKMANGTSKRVGDIKKGNQVATPSGSAKVICVVKTHCSGTTHLVELGNGLLVTPFHPVRVEGKWAFPESLGEVKERPCDAVYNFVLDGGHVMTINGVECVTLGHNFQEEVVQHPYFGSQRIIEDLKKMRGWTSGLIELQSGCLIRDNTTSLVSGIHHSAVLVA